jgi:hypothetical protein
VMNDDVDGAMTTLWQSNKKIYSNQSTSTDKQNWLPRNFRKYIKFYYLNQKFIVHFTVGNKDI